MGPAPRELATWGVSRTTPRMIIIMLFKDYNAKGIIFQKIMPENIDYNAFGMIFGMIF